LATFPIVPKIDCFQGSESGESGLEEAEFTSPSQESVRRGDEPLERLPNEEGGPAVKGVYPIPWKSALGPVAVGTKMSRSESTSIKDKGG
jgi:hypothetical protein